MNIFTSLYFIALFVALTPGVLLTLPKGGKKLTVAVVHGLVFALVWYCTNKMVSGFQDMEEYEEEYEEDYGEGFQNWANWGAIGNAFNNVGNQIAGGFNQTGNAFNQAGGQIAGGFNQAGQQIAGGFNQLPTIPIGTTMPKMPTATVGGATGTQAKIPVGTQPKIPVNQMPKTCRKVCS